MTPAFTNSSLNFAIAASSSSDGILPASESFVALTITMNRIAVSPLGCLAKSREDPGSTVTSNERPRNRQGHLILPINAIQVVVIKQLFFLIGPLAWRSSRRRSDEGGRRLHRKVQRRECMRFGGTSTPVQ